MIKQCRICNSDFETKGTGVYCGSSCYKKGRQEIYNRYKTKKGPIYFLLKGAEERANRKGLEFSLTEDDIVLPQYCPVLEIKLVSHIGERSGFFADSPSLDRIDNSEGYVKGNVMVISAKANLIKNCGTPEDIERVATYVKTYCCS
jgi:hypothetical protein